ncbi:MAG: hypothetical protein AB7C95_06465 [Synergistaceae bacterium]
MGGRGKSTVIKSASIPVELAELMEANNISPSEAMRAGIIAILEGRKFVIVNDEIERILDEKGIVKVEKKGDVDRLVRDVPVYQLPPELRAKKLAMNLMKSVKDTMMIDLHKIVEVAAANNVPIEAITRELKKLDVDII